METLEWSKQNNLSQARILDMEAIVEETHNGFLASIKDDLTTLRKAEKKFEDLPSAEEWIFFTAIEIEQSKDQDIAKKRMREAIEKITSTLRGSIHRTHIERLVKIQEWILHGSNYEKIMASEKSTSFQLDWKEVDAKSFTAKTPYGQAFIFERNSTQHEVWIEHECGAKYKSLEVFVDFLAAEYWVQMAVSQLNDSEVNEANLDCIHFTLDICKSFLLQKKDRLNIARLEYVGMLLDEVLP